MSETVATLRLPRKIIPDLPFVRILPEDLNAHWDFVERGLRLAMTKCGRPPWTPDDVLRCLVDEQAALYRREDGFVILEQATERFSLKRYLNVWLMWFVPGRARAIEQEIITWLDAMKLAQKCEWIEYLSPRDGWGIEPQFQRHMVIWRRA